MARYCYVIHGLLGGAMDAQTNIGAVPVWVRQSALIAGFFYAMELADNGSDPFDPWGLPMTVTGFLPQAYTAMYDTMSRVLPGYGFTVIPWSYDWRKELIGRAALLAADVRSRVGPADTCVLLGHSMGGLLARLAYADLKGTGHEGRVERIVTAGTPHEGSYGWPLVLGAGDLTVTGILASQSAVAGLLNSSPWGVPVAPYTLEAILQVAASWPSMYALLPPLQGDWQATDPDREWLYDAAHWPQADHLIQAHLDHVRNVLHPLLASEATRPPPGGLCTMQGTGFPTGARLAYPPALGDAAAIAKSPSGDGTVSLGSSRLDDYPTQLFPADHLRLVSDPTALGLLALMVAEGLPADMEYVAPAAAPSIAVAGGPLPTVPTAHDP